MFDRLLFPFGKQTGSAAIGANGYGSVHGPVADRADPIL